MTNVENNTIEELKAKLLNKIELISKTSKKFISKFLDKVVQVWVLVMLIYII